MTPIKQVRPGRSPLMPVLPGRAACSDVDPEVFFPTGSGRRYADEAREAKAVCARCPVRAACGTWAITRAEHGVWGGFDDHDRRAIRKAATAA